MIPLPSGLAFLGLAVFFEVCGTMSMKASNGFQHIVPTVAVFVLYCLSLANLTMALKFMEVGIAYAIWAGMGIIVITMAGALWFGESLNLSKIACIGLISAGVLGLYFSQIQLEAPGLLGK